MTPRLVTAVAVVAALAACNGSEPEYDELVPEGVGDSAVEAIEFLSANDPLDQEAESDRRMEYLLAERTWTPAEWAELTSVVDAAATETDAGTTEQSAELASQAVYYLSERDDLDTIADNTADEGNEVSTNVARLLGTHLVAVEVSYLTDWGTDFEPDAAGEVHYDGVGTISNVPVFEEEDVEAVARLATSTDEGIAELEDALAAHRREYLSQRAEEVAANPNDATAASVLDKALRNDARMVGMFMSPVNDGQTADEFYQISLDSVTQVLSDAGLPAEDLLARADYEEQYQQERP